MHLVASVRPQALAPGSYKLEMLQNHVLMGIA